MKAIRVTAPTSSSDLRATDVPWPEPGSGQVRVRLRTAALNHRELLILAGTWPEWGTFTLGSDGAGVVDALGNGVQAVKLGDEVLINPGLDWGHEQRAPRPSFNTLGGPTDGCFAEAVVLPAENVLPRPAYLTWEEAAAIPVACQSVFRGLVVRARLTATDTLLIHGIGGGVAQAGLMIAHAIGATTIVTSSSDDKLARAREMGADHTINYRTRDWKDDATELTGGNGPDVILDSVGGETLKHSVEAVRRGGRIVSLGVTTGAIEQFPIRPLYMRHVDLLGTTLGSPADFQAMLEFYASHGLRPVIDSVWSLDDIPHAMSRLDAGLQFGKIVLRISADDA